MNEPHVKNNFIARLDADHLNQFEYLLRSRSARRYFEDQIDYENNKHWFALFSYFVDDSPRGYWSRDLFEQYLLTLVKNYKRSIDAAIYWRDYIGNAIECCFHIPDGILNGDSIKKDKSSQMFKLATEIHPAYMTIAERMYGNLLRLFWSVTRKGDVKAKFDLRGAFENLKKINPETFSIGYDDRIRNAIAHGEATLKQDSVDYRSGNYSHEVAHSDVQAMLDDLWKNAISMAMAYIVFVAKVSLKTGVFDEKIIPISLLKQILASRFDYKGLKIVYLLESEVILTRKTQLNIFYKTNFRSPSAITFDALRISKFLLSVTNKYQRHAFTIDNSIGVTSFVGINSEVLYDIAFKNESSNTGQELLESPLIWSKESKARRWYLTIYNMMPTVFYAQRPQKKGVHTKYRVRRVDNRSTKDMARIELLVTLKDERDAKNKQLIKEICIAATRKYRRKFFKTGSFLEGFGLPRIPTYIWIKMYKRNASIRSLDAKGWFGDNLICTSEMHFSKNKKPLAIKNPEEVFHGVWFRSSADEKLLNEAEEQIIKTVESIKKNQH